MKFFSLKKGLFLMYFDMLVSGKILKNFWHVQFLHKLRISVWKGLSLVILLISNTG